MLGLENAARRGFIISALSLFRAAPPATYGAAFYMGRCIAVDENKQFWKEISAILKQQHAERVAKTPQRVSFAITQFMFYGISYKLKNHHTGHFHVWDKDGKLYQFWAGTGKIYGYEDKRGIKALLTLVRGEKTECITIPQQN